MGLDRGEWGVVLISLIPWVAAQLFMCSEVNSKALSEIRFFMLEKYDLHLVSSTSEMDSGFLFFIGTETAYLLYAHIMFIMYTFPLFVLGNGPKTLTLNLKLY